MKEFRVSAGDTTYEEGVKSGVINGGTVWLDNIAQALRWHGHQAQMESWHQPEGYDYLMCMSEFVHHGDIMEFGRVNPGKLIVMLDHFISGHKTYLDIETMKEITGYFFTTWEGELLDGFNAHFLPHAYNDLADDKITIDRRGSVVFVGNSYGLRKEDWFKSLSITKVRGVLPGALPAIYRGADVCVNLHGDFQKGIVVEGDERVADKPGMMVNERFWTVLGSGGLLVTDWVPQMARWFSEDELIVAHSEKEFKELVEYYVVHHDEGVKKLEPVRDKIREMHTYRNRAEDMLKHMELW